MSTNENMDELINRLARGWTKHEHRSLGQFAQMLARRLGSPDVSRKDSTDISQFWLYLYDIRLRGMQRIPCCLLGGDNEHFIVDNLSSFWNLYRTSDYIPFILALSQPALLCSQSILHNKRCLILSSAQLRELFSAERPQQILKRYLVQQAPIQWLNPYDYQHPATGAMFYGRETELAKLLHHTHTNFAIAGPGRMGKSSLMKQYRYQTLQQRNFNRKRIFEIDFSTCFDHTENGIARFFAMKIESKQMSDRMTVEGIVNFIRYQRSTVVREPLDLLLDEVDEVCNSDVFRQLGVAAREGLCRLILCGRGSLLQLMKSNDSSLANRIELIQLSPLELHEARNLLIQPLSDVGIAFEQTAKLETHIAKFTGCMPNLLQYYGKQIVELTEQINTKTIKMTHLHKLEKSSEFSHFFVSPLEGIDNSEHLNLALRILHEKPRRIKMKYLQETMEAIGLAVDAQSVMKARHDLIINNILTYRSGQLQIANDSLGQCAEQLGYYELLV